MIKTVNSDKDIEKNECVFLETSLTRDVKELNTWRTAVAFLNLPGKSVCYFRKLQTLNSIYPTIPLNILFLLNFLKSYHFQQHQTMSPINFFEFLSNEIENLHSLLVYCKRNYWDYLFVIEFKYERKVHTIRINLSLWFLIIII